MSLGLDWSQVDDGETWDRMLAKLRGHPLQSALWGDARKVVDHIEDQRWMGTDGENPVCLMRIEKRTLPVLGHVAWAPRGPAFSHDANDVASMIGPIGASEFSLIIIDRWRRGHSINSDQPKTIWIDLTVGRERLWRNLDRQWRYGVGRAERLGVVVRHAQSARETHAFYDLCAATGDSKGFRLRASRALMSHLLMAPSTAAVHARLFLAYVGPDIGAGAFVIRCGESVHYMWGAIDRRHSTSRVGEAVQWAVIEWALANGVRCYDLEGIDPDKSPGVYAFKKKMGGEEVTLEGKRYLALDLKGKLASFLMPKLFWLRK